MNECFVHIPGVGQKTEYKLKKSGFHTWMDCIKNPDKLPLTKSKKQYFLDYINTSLEKIEADDINYFIKTFPISEHWRILKSYFDKAVFFDIETTGLSYYGNHITVISAYRDKHLYSFIYNDNLDDFLNFIEESTLLVSYNGSSFDIPFIEKTFNIPEIECPHVDLRWIAYYLGFTGGLKKIELSLGVNRPHELMEIDGLEAVTLYRKYQDGDAYSLKKLLSYCQTDVLSTYLVSCMILNRAGCSIDIPDSDMLFRTSLNTLNL